jgi:hypothetical protein
MHGYKAAFFDAYTTYLGVPVWGKPFDFCYLVRNPGNLKIIVMQSISGKIRLRL